ncbi:hypothetical protein ABTL78_19730, partial [Acinetobacter baumannii]
DSGYTFLHLAAESRSFAITRYIITLLGANASQIATIANKRGEDALHAVLRYGDRFSITPMATLIGDKQFEKMPLDNDGNNYLHLAMI